MKCKKCSTDIREENSKYLKCFECKRNYHFSCLTNVTENDFEYLKSSGSNWKCELCVKAIRSDETPVSPVTQKEFFSSAKGSDGDSSQSDSSKHKIKVTCKKCVRGFSYNSHRAICSKCDGPFHFNCINISKDEYLKMSKSWMCSGCDPQAAAAVSGGGRSTTDKTAPATDITLSDLFYEMKSFRAEVTRTNREMTDSMNKYSEWIDEYGVKIDSVTIKLTDLTREIGNYRQENLNLKKQVNELTDKINVLEQSAKENVVEIHGVPAEKNENLMTILRKISTVIGFDFDETQIDNCYRYLNNRASNNISGGIVVRFVRKLDMEMFMKKRKEKRNVNSRDLGFMAGNATPIYVNYSLTAAKRKLLNLARAAKREKEYTYIWVKNGRIFMRKNQGDRFVIVDSEEDINKL